MKIELQTSFARSTKWAKQLFGLGGSWMRSPLALDLAEGHVLSQ